MKTYEGHTPGPWAVQPNTGKSGGIGIVADGAPCVIAQGLSEKHWPAIARANAALIAAAPDLLRQRDQLLAACKEIARIVPSMDWSDCIESHNQVVGILDGLTDAIALCESEAGR